MALAIQKKIKSYAVVKPGDAAVMQPKADAFVPEADRRIRLESVPVPLAASLRWQKRPHLPQGNDSRTYMVRGPSGLFAVEVGHVENGHKEPFETWIKGDTAPRGLSALARSLSMDMRSRDRSWLRKKLEALTKVKDQRFVMTMPDGFDVDMPSEVAAFARLVLYRCEELGAFADTSETPILNALASKREPKTQATGAASWSVDVANPATGDDFLLTLKEVEYPDGTRRPFSVWISGDYPRSLDGLCKSLSLDMRVVDVDWPIRKLKQLLDVAETNCGFMAQVPGSEKSAFYPSTVAYIAALILHRYNVLGLTDETDAPLKKMGVVSIEEAREARASEAKLGMLNCSECGGVATVRRDGGCDTCARCGSSHCG